MIESKRAEPNRHELTDVYLRSLLPRDRPFRVWDTRQHGLCVMVQPSGVKSFLVAYKRDGKLRWYTIARYGRIGIKEARSVALKLLAKVADGKDPQARKMQKRREQRDGDTLTQVHERYLEQVKETNKSWLQASNLLRRYVLPTLGRRKLKDIDQADMWKIFDGLSDRKSLANQVLAAASAVFTWAMKRRLIQDNPCRGIQRHETRSAVRFLSNDEIRKVWLPFDDRGLYASTILKLILLTGQRPGEVCSMRWEHLANRDKLGFWWSMPGARSEIWPGTKNGRDHEVLLSAPVVDLLRELGLHRTGYVFPSRAGCVPIPSTQGVWKKMGIPRFRPHDLRATCATGMDALGIIRQHISLVLNHVEGGVTASYVRHDQRKHKRTALEAWSQELLMILEGKGKTDHHAEVI